MTIKQQFSAKLNGRQVTEEMSDVDNEAAANLGLVIVFGQSDDLMEFRGRIYDEIDAWRGSTAYISGRGDISNNEEERALLVKYGVPFTLIDAIWSPTKEGEESPYCSWLIDAEELETASFDIFDGEQLYCRGIVFDYADLLK